MMQEILNELEQRFVVLREQADLETILAEAEELEMHDTLISDYIRIMSYNGRTFTQELTLKNEVALRGFESLQKAQEFVTDRLAVYEKMWDGCGCKVDYYK
jgi:hypothetical protein